MSATQSGLASPGCPVCAKPVQSEFRPFCSARCKAIDLHRWLGEVYRVPISDAQAESGQARPNEPDDPANS